MRRLLMASALFALSILTTTATGQPPASDPKPKVDKDKKADKKADKKPADPTDALIASAIASDPDVRMAKAKLQLAEAELAKARLAATQKVLAAQSAVQDAKTAVLVAETQFEGILLLYKAEKIPNPETRMDYRLALAKLEAAKAKLATAETELKLLTGGATGAGGGFGLSAPNDPEAGLRALERFLKQQESEKRSAETMKELLDALLKQNAVKGPIPERIRAALDKNVTLPKGNVPFEKAREVFKQAGLDVPIRIQAEFGNIDSDGEELPIGAWFQLYQDSALGRADVGRPAFFVRDYGLLYSYSGYAPPDAIPLGQFWRQTPAPKPEPKPELKPEPAPEPK